VPGAHFERTEYEIYILRIEHPVADFDDRKKAFDAAPVGRKQSGVRSYQIMRPADNPNYVMVDLLFDTVGAAEALLATLRVLWGRVKGTVVQAEPATRIIEQVETVTLRRRRCAPGEGTSLEMRPQPDSATLR